jgi:hypothetical protein
MLTAVCGPDGKASVQASINGVAIYLDNFAIKLLAKGDASLRQRLVAVLQNGADLLFSVGHAVEVIGPRGASSIAFRHFLDDLGAHWCPIEFDVFKVMAREKAGAPRGDCCFAENLLTAFFDSRASDQSQTSAKIIDLSEQFFRLGTFVDWLAPRRDWFRDKREGLDDVLLNLIGPLRAKFKRNPGWLDAVLPQRQFDPSRAATFAFENLVRDLVSDCGYQVKKGDGMDFHHSVMASGYATFATLDKHWKRRVENLPRPNTVARIYCEPEIGTMLDDIETALGYEQSNPLHSPQHLYRADLIFRGCALIADVSSGRVRVRSSASLSRDITAGFRMRFLLGAAGLLTIISGPSEVVRH